MFGRTSIGRYKLVKRLSVGGMAEVFLAVAQGPGEFRKFVTIKRILPDYQEDEDFVRMFLEEARISAALSHSAVAQVYDLHADDDELYLAMEYVAGEDLHRMLRVFVKGNVPVPIGLACMVIRDAAYALHHAHSFVDSNGVPAPIIHRDVSPKNIMLSYSGSVKIVDFGIAKMRYESLVARSTSVKGSSGYMSPEQLEGQNVDAKSDQFSLGAVMYEMLTGSPAFGNQKRGRVVVPQVDEVVPAHHVRDAIGEPLSAVVAKALHADPHERFMSCKELARAIEATAPELFDQERAAAVMQQMFADSIAAIRHILTTGEVDNQPVETEPNTDTDVEHTQREQQRTAQLRSNGELASPLIMVVDDSHASLQVLKAQLGRAGFNVLGASNGHEALGLLDTQKPDAIILDVVMPELSGYEVCRKIREREKFQTTPILFVSAACSLEERIRGLEAGGDDFIRKPYAAAELALRVRSHLARIAVLHDPN